jgi:hypothetical protein
VKLSHTARVGLSILVAFIVFLAYYGKLEGIFLFLGFCFFGWLGISLYEFKAKTWIAYLLLKIPLNIFFNPFLLILLLKSWTMLKYKSQLEELESQITAMSP